MRRCWCARCGRSSTIPANLAETRIKCGTCGYIQEIPEPGGYPIEPAPIGSPTAPEPNPSSEKAVATDRRSSWFRSYAIEHSRLQGFSAGLVAISAADLFMTFTLLRTHHTFYESNPIALWIFHRWDMAGMVIFKFSMIALAIALSEIIERHRPGWGKAILALGCVAAAYAFTHGLRLFLGFGGGGPAVEG